MRAPDRRPQAGGARAGTAPAARTTAPPLAEAARRAAAVVKTGSLAPEAAGVVQRAAGHAGFSVASVNAHAYTSGAHIVFQRGRYDGSSAAGRHMLAHELTHVIQQRSGPVAGTDRGDGTTISDPSDRFEREQSARLARLRRTTADEDGPYELMTEEGLLWNSPEFEHSTGAPDRTGPGCIAELSQRNLASMRSENRDRGQKKFFSKEKSEPAWMEPVRQKLRQALLGSELHHDTPAGRARAMLSDFAQREYPEIWSTKENRADTDSTLPTRDLKNPGKHTEPVRKFALGVGALEAEDMMAVAGRPAAERAAASLVIPQVRGDEESTQNYYGEDGKPVAYKERLFQNILHGPDIIPGLPERDVMEFARFEQSNPKPADSLKGMSGEALMNYLLKYLLRPQAMLPHAAQIAEENISHHVST